MFDFTASSPYEMDASEGEVVHVIEEDDGSGWVKVKNSAGKKGLVPASYIAEVDGNTTSEEEPAAAYVRCIYSYVAQGPDELSVNEGEIIQLTPGPNGGKNYADGWWEGVNPNSQIGIFPSNYVEDYVY